MYIFINYAGNDDLDYLAQNDIHISREMIEKKIGDREIIAARVDGKLVGWLRYNYFWDNTPFMNMLYLEEDFRKRGIGSKVVLYWEKVMKEQGYNMVMTSTQADEEGQFFYRENGYRDAGCLLLENQALEILFKKTI